MTYNLVSLRVLEVYVVVDDNNLWVGCEVLELPGYVTMYAGVCRSLQEFAGICRSWQDFDSLRNTALPSTTGLCLGWLDWFQDFAGVRNMNTYLADSAATPFIRRVACW